MDRRGEMGVGVMIIFIAVIMIAALAAGVLISTVTSLQQKATTTGSEALKEITSRVTILQLMAENGSDGAVENMSMLARLSAGSDPINLNSTLLVVALSNATANLQYMPNAQLGTVDIAQRYYSVITEVRGPEYKAGYISNGDIVTLLFITPRNMTNSEKGRISLIGRYGSPSVVEFWTPTSVNTQTILLYP